MPKLSKQGWVATILAASMILSIFGNFRLNLAGLLIHPYLLLLLPLAYIGKVKIFQFKRSPVYYLVAYGAIFSLSMIVHELNLSEVFKIFAGVFSFIFFAMAVQSENDYRFPAYMLVALSLILAIKIILLGQSGEANLLAGISVLEAEGLGNKNAQSLYILPGMFFTFFLLSDGVRRKSYLEIVLLAVTIIPIILGVAYSGNRSGYIGVALVLVVFFLNFRINAVLLILMPLIFYFSFRLVDKYAGELIAHKLDQSTGGYESDDLRENLLVSSVLIGLENPILGLGFTGLIHELPHRINSTYAFVDPHNIYGYLLGAGGIFPFLFFILFIWRVFRQGWKHYRLPSKLRKQSGNVFIGLWLCGYVVLFMTRGIFTREILYSPTFMAGLGILFGAILYHKGVLIDFLSSVLARKEQTDVKNIGLAQA